MIFNALPVNKLCLSITVFLLFFSLHVPSFAAPSKNSWFLKNDEGQRIWWYMGAFTSLGHIVSQSDPKKADCIWNWSFKEPKEKQKLLEETMRKYPDHSPSGIILALLYKDCGKFTIKLDQ